MCDVYNAPDGELLVAKFHPLAQRETHDLPTAAEAVRG